VSSEARLLERYDRTVGSMSGPPQQLTMHIGLNLLYLLPGIVGGTETYATSLIRALSKIDDGDRYTVYVNREAAALDFGDAPNVEMSVCEVNASSRSARYAFEQFRLPAQVRRDRVDLLHSLGYVGPLRSPCPHVVTIHDLIYSGFAPFMPARRRIALQTFVRGTARRAAQIITVSRASKAEIVADIGVDPDRVSIVPHAPRPDMAPAADSEESAADRAVLATYGITQPYVAAFGSLSASKNLPRLIEALASLGDEQWRLVLLGHVPADGEVASSIAQHGVADRVMTTGYLPETHIAPLTRCAQVFAFPSLYEGFGLPALDAQAAGVPLACSNAASLPEVAGDGALYFDPTSAGDIAAVLRRLLTDGDLRTELVERGRTNVARFSWDRTAQGTREVYRQVVSAGGATSGRAPDE
jgi:glycosyltransferase involved in cell wall biosynthesis